MIRIEALSKSYGDYLAVDGLGFAIEAGEILGLVGPNGAGKTTTMRCITGIIPPSHGNIMIGEHDLRADPLAAKRQMAFVPAEVRVFDHLTVREHLIFFQRMYVGVDKRSQDPDALLEELELSDKRFNLPGTLSRGMKQKLMIACALIHFPRVLIMDEPFTGLDPHAIRLMRGVLKARAQEGCVVLISSHLLGMVEGLVSKVLVIQNGKKVAYGSLAELGAGSQGGLEDIFLKITTSERNPMPEERMGE